MKKILFMLLFILAGAQTMKAQEAYAVYTDNNTTLTFYYDTQRSSRTGTTYDLNGGANRPKWVQDGTNAKVTRVVFDSSFKNARRESTSQWFFSMGNLTSIIGMKEYLNTSETIWLSYMFAGCKSLTSIDVSQFNTSKVKYMECMFSNCSALTSLDVSHWDTSNALNMFGLFGDCEALTDINLSNFDTSNVTDMESMFGGSYNLKSLNLCSFNTAKVTNMKNMFFGCGGLITISVGSGWTTAGVDPNTEMFNNCKNLVGGQGTSYTGGIGLTAKYAHIDGGPSNPGYFWDGPAPLPSYANYNNGTLTFYHDYLRSTRAGKTYDLNSGNTNPGWFTEGVSASVTKVVFDASFANARPTSTYYWFNSCANLTSITGWENLNTSEVTNMREMFSDCRKITNLNLNQFNTSKVTNMSGMFQNCLSLKKLSFSYLFSTTNVTDMSYMFYDCSAMTSFDLSYFKTSNVTDMRYMFYECDAVTTLDLSTFDTGNVTNMASMFGECDNLTTINIGSGWSTAKLTTANSSNAMFANTKQIRGMQGTTYNASYVDKTYARLDEGTSKPGYLSTITYNLKVGGVEVTDMNKDNIPIASGAAKFNGSVLVLTDATVAGNASWGSIHCTRDNLTIAVNGSCTLNGTVNFRGSSYIYFTDNSDDDELTVNGMFNFKGSLQFYNRKTVISTSSASYMFMGDGTTSKLEFGKNATVIGIMNGGTQIAYNITGLTFKSPTSFTFGSLGADDSQVSFSATQKTILMDGQPLKGILAVGQYYPLWFGDLQMSSTIPLYIKSLLSQDAFSISEADDGTLVMKTYPLFAVITYNNNTFRSEAENLRVELGCDWTVTSEDADTPAMILQGNTTITGTGKLTVESAGIGIQLGKGVTSSDTPSKGDLTIDGMDMEVTAAKQGVCGSMRIINGVSLYDNTLTFKNSTATITSSGSGTAGYCLYRLKNLVLTGCQITNGVTFTGSLISAPKVVIGLGSGYDLNNDGKVSTADIQVIINEMKKPQASQNMDYDLNNDGKISTADIQVIINEMKK